MRAWEPCPADPLDEDLLDEDPLDLADLPDFRDLLLLVLLLPPRLLPDFERADSPPPDCIIAPDSFSRRLPRLASSLSVSISSRRVSLRSCSALRKPSCLAMAMTLA